MKNDERRARAEAAERRARILEGQKVEVVAAPTLFPTPREIVAQMIDLADIDDGMDILEPSAGTGAILSAIPPHCQVQAVEIDYRLAARLNEAFPFVKTIQADFLCLGPEDIGAFDVVLMNPPFDRGQDITHIRHALNFVRPGGRVVAICADGPRQQKAIGEALADSYEPLPEGSFSTQGTMVSTALAVITKRQS